MVRKRAPRDAGVDELTSPEISPDDYDLLDELLAADILIDDQLDELLERDAELDRLLSD
jgi:hypothetical protein